MQQFVNNTKWLHKTQIPNHRYGSKKWESLDGTMRELIGPLHEAMMEMIPMIDADTDAFNDYMTAMRLPKQTEEEKEVRGVWARELSSYHSNITVSLTSLRIF